MKARSLKERVARGHLAQTHGKDDPDPGIGIVGRDPENADTDTRGQGNDGQGKEIDDPDPTNGHGGSEGIAFCNGCHRLHTIIY